MVSYRDMTDKERQEYTRESIEIARKREEKFKRKRKRKGRIIYSKCVKQLSVNLDHPFEVT